MPWKVGRGEDAPISVIPDLVSEQRERRVSGTHAAAYLKSESLKYTARNASGSLLR